MPLGPASSSAECAAPSEPPAGRWRVVSPPSRPDAHKPIAGAGDGGVRAAGAGDRLAEPVPATLPLAGAGRHSLSGGHRAKRQRARRQARVSPWMARSRSPSVCAPSDSSAAGGEAGNTLRPRPGEAAVAQRRLRAGSCTPHPRRVGPLAGLWLQGARSLGRKRGREAGRTATAPSRRGPQPAHALRGADEGGGASAPLQRPWIRRRPELGGSSLVSCCCQPRRRPLRPVSHPFLWPQEPPVPERAHARTWPGLAARLGREQARRRANAAPLRSRGRACEAWPRPRPAPRCPASLPADAPSHKWPARSTAHTSQLPAHSSSRGSGAGSCSAGCLSHAEALSGLAAHQRARLGQCTKGRVPQRIVAARRAGSMPGRTGTARRRAAEPLLKIPRRAGEQKKGKRLCCWRQPGLRAPPVRQWQPRPMPPPRPTASS